MDTQPFIARAQAALSGLAEACAVRDLAVVAELADSGPHLLRALLKHELVCDHGVKMRLAAKVDHFLALVADDRPLAEQALGCRLAAQLSAASGRLSGHYRHGLAVLTQLERRLDGEARRRRKDALLDDDGDDDPPGGGTRKSAARIIAELAALEKEAAAMLDEHARNGAGPKPNGNGGAPAAPGATLRRRGTLRHGNPSGDFLAAPRCGARCRSGAACRQPAMANGRCRLHGGKSTGARTPEGLARCRTATLVHGGRSAEIIDLKAAAARRGRAVRALTAAAKAWLRQDAQSARPTPCPATPHPQVHAETRRRERNRAVIHLASAFFAPPRAHPRSERPTPCPATRHERVARARALRA